MKRFANMEACEILTMPRAGGLHPVQFPLPTRKLLSNEKIREVFREHQMWNMDQVQILLQHHLQKVVAYQKSIQIKN